jgi:hypothetical protein
MRRPKPHPTPRPRAPTPLSMRKHTGTHTCDVWSKRTGDGGLEETLANKTIKPPAPLRHCQWQKKVRQPSEPEPKPTPSLATTHTKQKTSKQANRWDRG